MSVSVTVLCGELGAGKTTLLSALLESTDREIAVLVNDVGAVNVDADLVEARTDLATGEEVVALENGCICCSLGGELSRSVVQLQREHEFDHLVVEASGVSEPEPIARQFVRGPAAGVSALDAVVTVVDARRFHDRFAGADGGSVDQPPSIQGADETGTRPLSDLVLEQIEFCDLLVVNKRDLVSETERDRVVTLLETLQPRAELVTTEYGTVDPGVLLESGRFDLEAAAQSAGWKRAVDGFDADDERHHDRDAGADSGVDREQQYDHTHESPHAHSHPPERYGIEVDTYHRRRPFHPERFAALLADLPDGLVRSKGLCWLAGRERQAITASYAGSETTLEVTGRWIASFPPDRQETYRRGQPELAWDDEWGDREIRLALIGREFELTDLVDRLDDCLLTAAEMDADWTDFENLAPTAMGELTTISHPQSRADSNSSALE